MPISDDASISCRGRATAQEEIYLGLAEYGWSGLWVSQSCKTGKYALHLYLPHESKVQFDINVINIESVYTSIYLAF